jgi:hypothetical protein
LQRDCKSKRDRKEEMVNGKGSEIISEFAARVRGVS